MTLAGAKWGGSLGAPLDDLDKSGVERERVRYVYSLSI